MKTLLTVFSFALWASVALALHVTTKDGKIYSDAEVKKVEAEGVRITHRDGTAFVDFDNLPASLQKQYGWTAEKSAARKAAQAAIAEKQGAAAAEARRQQEARKAERTAAAEAQRITGENARRAQEEKAALISKAQQDESQRAQAEQTRRAKEREAERETDARREKHEQQDESQRAQAEQARGAKEWEAEREADARQEKHRQIMGGALLALPTVLFVLVAFCWVKRAKSRRIRNVEIQNVEIKRQHEELRRFTEYAAAHNAFPTVATRILLKDGEVAFYDAPSALYEKRAVRYWVSGSIGFRVARGVYVGGTRGRSVSEQEWGKIDTGTLTITNRRIIFNGGGIDRTVILANVMAVEPWFDGVEISIEKRQKGMCFGVKNPVLVGALIQYLARGDSPGVVSPARTHNPQLPPPI